jgi:hypothetical protein
VEDVPCLLYQQAAACFGWNVQQTSRFATHPSKSLKPHLEGEISVHIAICKSMSQNLHDEMSCCAIPSH